MRRRCLMLLGALILSGCTIGKTFVYRYDFNDETALMDWVMEGSGVARIENGTLLLYSRFLEQLKTKNLEDSPSLELIKETGSLTDALCSA